MQTAYFKFKAIMLIAALLTATQIARAENWQLATRLYGDAKARHVGDILTVQIIEEASNTREASHQTGKRTGISGSLSFTRPRIDNRPTPWTNAVLPEFSAQANRNFEGGGSSKNQEQIKATMAVRVIEVLPNRNLMIEGRRTLTVQGDEVTFLLTGTVRPNDIARENTVKSTAISDLNMQYLSSGSLASSQKKGFFTSIIDWVNPF